MELLAKHCGNLMRDEAGGCWHLNTFSPLVCEIHPQKWNTLGQGVKLKARGPYPARGTVIPGQPGQIISHNWPTRMRSADFLQFRKET